jgi:hypothetical protein
MKDLLVLFLRNWRRVLDVVGVVVLLAMPLFLGGAFQYLPSAWVTWTGALVTVAAVGVWQRVGTPGKSVGLVLIAGPGLLLIFFSDSIHDWGRMKLQGPALEAYLDGGPCPSRRCVREPGAQDGDRGLALMVLGERGPLWSGFCHDAGDRLKAAVEADRLAREAGKERLAHHFGSRIHRTDPLEKGWSSCSGAVVAPKAQSPA